MHKIAQICISKSKILQPPLALAYAISTLGPLRSMEMAWEKFWNFFFHFWHGPFTRRIDSKQIFYAINRS